MAPRAPDMAGAHKTERRIVGQRKPVYRVDPRRVKPDPVEVRRYCLPAIRAPVQIDDEDRQRHDGTRASRPARRWRRAVAIAQACENPPFLPGRGANPAGSQGLLYSAGDPTERVAYAIVKSCD